MTLPLLDAIYVNALLWVFYTLPALPLAARYLNLRDWPEVLLCAVLLGTASQALLGTMWGVSPFTGLLGEGLLFAGCWAAIGLRCKRRTPPSRPALEPAPTVLLLGILLLAFAVRTIEPLRHYALGQSDAYAHLTFLRDIVAKGGLRVSVYPPGYHWVLALPMALFRMDPYLVARYGGAFCGTLLVLCLFVLGRVLHSRRAGLFAAFFAACFPGLYLLVKTGIGVFANQYGLVLVAGCFLALTVLVKTQTHAPRYAGLFILLCAALAVSVPMMLLNVLLVTGLVAALYFWTTRSRLPAGSRRWMAGGAALLLAVLVGFVATRDGLPRIAGLTTLGGAAYDHFFKTYCGFDIKPSQDPVAALFLDYIWVKRFGLGSPAMNLAGVILLLGCLGATFTGLRRHRAAWLVPGTWGTLSAVQTLTGVLQFSAYQRAGWELLAVAACLMGVAADLVYSRGASYRAVRWATGIAVGAVSITALLHPPAHQYMLSPCEDDIVRVVRELEHSRTGPGSWWRPYVHFEQASTSGLAEGLEQERAITVVTRKFTGMGGRAAEPVSAVLRTRSPVKAILVHSGKGPLRMPNASRVYVCLLDGPAKASQAGTYAPTRTFSAVSPRLAGNMAKWHRQLMRFNTDIEETVASLREEGARVRTFQEGKHLRVLVVEPAVPKGSGS